MPGSSSAGLGVMGLSYQAGAMPGYLPIGIAQPLLVPADLLLGVPSLASGLI